MKTERELIEHEGREYEKVHGPGYCLELVQAGVPCTWARKRGAVFAYAPEPGTEFAVFTEDGRIEAREAVRPGCWVLARADASGLPYLDGQLRLNMWQAEEATVRERYEVPDGPLPDGIMIRPKGPALPFLEADRAVALSVPWGKDGSPIMLYVEKGGYVACKDPEDVYGVAREEFGGTYEITRTGKPPYWLSDGLYM